MKNVKITDFKTKRINALTGGVIGTFTIPDYPEPGGGILENSFLAKDGQYIGTYSEGWWYVRKNMVVCEDYPHGVSIVLKSHKPKIILKNAIKDKFESWFTEQLENDNLVGYFGYTDRGGQTFKIGDRLFDENYIPDQNDYTKEEWDGFEQEWKKYCEKEVTEGYEDSIENAVVNLPVSDVIPFIKRGNKLIETWGEAKQAAINMSKYLS